MKKTVLAIGTGLGAGYVPFCPGTVGTLWGVLICSLVWTFFPHPLWQAGVSLFFLALAVWTGTECEKFFKNKDHRFIVIDEISGFLVAMVGLAPSPLFIGLGFIFFRLFDILKPFKIERLQKLKGGWGITLDDIAAGLLANIFLRVVISMAGW